MTKAESLLKRSEMQGRTPCTSQGWQFKICSSRRDGYFRVAGVLLGWYIAAINTTNYKYRAKVELNYEKKLAK